MYLATLDRGPGRTVGRVSGTVLALGTVSLITDVSAEMVTAILPLYLVAGLQFSPAAYGVIDGVYTGATVLLRLAGGYIADRIARLKAVAAAGYAISALAKLGLLAAGASGPLIGLTLTVDRAGKGLRTAPRDALITMATPPEHLGRAFGVHRTMDAAGAFLGPLVALGVLALSGQTYEPVFVASFCVALLGVLVLVLFVPGDRAARALPVPAGGGPPGGRVSLRAAGRLARGRLLPAACLLGLVTIGDGFVYLVLQRRVELSIGWFPLLAVGTSLAYLTLSVPLGRLADRIGRPTVVLGGLAALAGVYLLLGSPLGGPPLVLLVLALHGAFYAATDGVLMAVAGTVFPAELRTTGMALVQSGQAAAYVVSSLLFGLAWQSWGTGAACLAAAAAAVLALPLMAVLLRRRV
ncbi:MFS transporter [Nonomuraea jiangxiensis]|uniref:Sugar phosphate permease n=1 Tax=Nonomuraea jiangxiensis TaxID=633440 RepID=A0A1G8QHJ4_9ACTN|nr:MFS transporter [Nonomuraea jiangxiensis]SDJ04242.1 Sugar phosphate permease [Nonomuraea jiangxiensis]